MRQTLLLLLSLAGFSVTAQPTFELVWGDTSRDELATNVHQFASGSIFVLGHGNIDSIGLQDIQLTKVSSTGNIIWEKCMGTADYEYVQDHCITAGNHIVACGGYRKIGQEDGMIMKMDTNGSVLWTKYYGDTQYYQSLSYIETTPDGGYIACGFANDTVYQGNNILVVKVDSLGNSEWVKQYGDTINDYGQAIKPTPDGGYILCGDRIKASQQYDIVTIKLDSAGNVEWEYFDVTNLNGGSQNMIITSDGNYLVVGEHNTQLSNWFDVVLLKVNKSGAMLWRKYVNWTLKSEAGFDVLEDTINWQYLICGYGHNPAANENDLMFLNTDTTGTLLGQTFYGATGAIDIAHDIIPSNSGGYLLTGETTIGVDKQFILIHDSVPLPLAIQEPVGKYVSALVYPNPIRSGEPLNIRTPGTISGLTLYSLTGERIRLLNGAQQQHTLDVSPGLYILSILTSEGTAYKRLIVTE